MLPSFRHSKTMIFSNLLTFLVTFYCTKAWTCGEFVNISKIMLTCHFCMLTCSDLPIKRLNDIYLKECIIYHYSTFWMHIVLWRNNILILSPALRFIPSLIGFGIANPTDVPHLTSVPWNSADMIAILRFLLYILDIDVNIDLNIDNCWRILDGVALSWSANNRWTQIKGWK